MAKFRTSISIDTRAFATLKKMADKYHDGNVSKVIEWFGFSKQERTEYLKHMAKFHMAQGLRYKEELDDIRKEILAFVQP